MKMNRLIKFTFFSLFACAASMVSAKRVRPTVAKFGAAEQISLSEAK